MAADEKRPARKVAAKKAAKRAPAKKAAKGRRRPANSEPSEQDRADAAAQIANVVPIKHGTTSQRGRHNAGRAGKGRHAPNSPQQLALHDRREMALNLRRLGLQWSQVAAKIREDLRAPNGAPLYPNYSTQDAHNDARSLIDAVTITAVQGVREDDLAMLLALQRRVFPEALDGDLKAVDRMLKILDQRARYLGLYAPTRHELTGTGGGPIGLSPEASPREVFDAAFTQLDAVLGHVEHAALPDPTAPPEPQR